MSQIRNLFAEYGYRKEEIEDRLEQIFQTIFYGAEGEKFYYEAGADMGYLTDTGNNDVRTEGMSYGMMMTVQLDKQKEFNRIWKWVKTYMYHYDGVEKGYFRWSCKLNGQPNAEGPAPDGEEFFAMALIFASRRWGDREGIFNYIHEARELLRTVLHKGEDGNSDPMWEASNKYIKFIPNCDWSDPSYHLPHFYEIFAEEAYEEDREFWKEAAKASRQFLQLSCHPVTGLAPEYADYDGTPHTRHQNMFGGRHDWYYSDAYRVASNIGIDYLWNQADPWQQLCADRIQTFFEEKCDYNDLRIYEIDGTILDKTALHPVAIIATNAAASLASDGVGKYAKKCVERFWNTPLRTGNRRYYDNCLYLFAFMALSGNYKKY